GDLGRILRPDAARRLQDALQQILGRAELADVRQVRADLRAAALDLVATAAVDRLRPEQLFAADRIPLEGEDGARPRVGAELARPLVVGGQVALEQVA